MATAACCAGKARFGFAARVRLASLSVLIMGCGVSADGAGLQKQSPDSSVGRQQAALLPDAATANNGNEDQDILPEILGFLQGGTASVEMHSAAEAFSMASVSDGNYERPPPSKERYLQAVCAAGDDFSVSSTLFSAAEGCYQETVEDSYIYTTASNDRVIGLVVFSTASSDAVPVWTSGPVVAATSAGSVLVDIECLANEVSGLDSHPTDVAEWACVVGSAFLPVSGQSFSADCGCSDTGVDGTPSPADAGAPTPAISPTPSGDSGCSGTDPFSITSTTFEDFEGCYLDGGVDSSSFFSQTGEFEGGLEAVFTSFLDQEQQDPRWIVGVYADDASSAEVAVKCISAESPAVAHPADSTWFCDLTGTGAFTVPSDAQFSITCDCNFTSSASADESPSPVSFLPSSTSSPGGDTGSNPTSAPAPSVDQPTVNQPIASGQAGTSGAAVAYGAAFGYGRMIVIVYTALVGLAGLLAVA